MKFQFPSNHSAQSSNTWNRKTALGVTGRELISLSKEETNSLTRDNMKMRKQVKLRGQWFSLGCDYYYVWILFCHTLYFYHRWMRREDASWTKSERRRKCRKSKVMHYIHLFLFILYFWILVQKHEEEVLRRIAAAARVQGQTGNTDFSEDGIRNEVRANRRMLADVFK